MHKISVSDPVVEAIIDLGYTRDGLFCVRDSNNAWLLDCGSPGHHTALVIMDTEPVPEGSELKFVSGHSTIVYDDTQRAVLVIAERNEFFITPSNEIIIRIDPMYPDFVERGHEYIWGHLINREGRFMSPE